MDAVNTDLAHYGKKGMRWGVITEKAKDTYSKARTENTTPTPITVKAAPGKKIKTEGGKYQPTSEDAIKAAIGKQKATKSGLQALSNAELQAVVTRQNLEQQYARLNPRQMLRGEQTARDLLMSDAPEYGLNLAQVIPDARVQAGAKVAHVLLQVTRKKIDKNYKPKPLQTPAKDKKPDSTDK